MASKVGYMKQTKTIKRRARPSVKKSIARKKKK